jgi:hypothetical protein
MRLGVRLRLVDGNDELRGFADSLLGPHDGGVLVAAGVLGAIGGDMQTPA